VSAREAVPPGLRAIRGPSALGGESRRFWTLTWTLAILEFRLKFFGSVLGYLWQLMRPLMLFGVLYVVFTEFVRIGAGVRFYPVVLLLGIVMFTFFSEVTGTAVTSVVNRENLVRKIQFPRLVIPLSVVLTSYLNLLLNLVAVGVFMLASGVALRLTWLEIFPLTLLLGLYCTGIAMGLSALFVRYRDVQPIWDVALPMTFYGSPILYPIEALADQPDWVQTLVMCNPLAVIVQQARHALIDPDAPSAAAAIGGAPLLLIPAAILVGVCVVGFLVFDRAAPHIAEEL
jgi:ABC-2 type transport system permease protein